MAFLADVVAGKIDWSVDVRVIRLWVVPDHRDKQIANSLEMVLLDEKVSFLSAHYLKQYFIYSYCDWFILFSQLDRIHATVKRSLLIKFHPVIKEGSAYRLDKLLVSANDVKFPTTSHKFKFHFMALTKCVPIETDKIPNNHFCFMPFTEILQASRDDLLTGLFFCFWLVIGFFVTSYLCLGYILLDVIGHLVRKDTLKDYERHGRQTRYLQFTLEDLRYV